MNQSDNKPTEIFKNIEQELRKASRAIEKITFDIYPKYQTPLAHVVHSCAANFTYVLRDQLELLNKAIHGISDVEQLICSCRQMATKDGEQEAIDKIILSRISGPDIFKIDNISELSNPLMDVFEQLNKWQENKKHNFIIKENLIKNKIDMVYHVCANVTSYSPTASEKTEIMLLAQACNDNAGDERTFPKCFEQLNCLINKIKIFSKEKQNPSPADDITMFTIIHRAGNLNFLLNNTIVFCSTKEQRDQLMSMYDFCYERIAFSNDFYNRSFNNIVNFKMRLEGKKEIDFSLSKPNVEKEEIQKEQHVKGFSYIDSHEARYNEIESIYQKGKKNCFMEQQRLLLNIHYNNCFIKVRKDNEFGVSLEKFIRYVADLELCAEILYKQSVSKEEVSEQPKTEIKHEAHASYAYPSKEWGKWGNMPIDDSAHVPENVNLAFNPDPTTTIFKQTEITEKKEEPSNPGERSIHAYEESEIRALIRKTMALDKELSDQANSNHAGLLKKHIANVLNQQPATKSKRKGKYYKK